MVALQVHGWKMSAPKARQTRTTPPERKTCSRLRTSWISKLAKKLARMEANRLSRPLRYKRFANGFALYAKFDEEFASRSQTYAGTGHRPDRVVRSASPAAEGFACSVRPLRACGMFDSRVVSQKVLKYSSCGANARNLLFGRMAGSGQTEPCRTAAGVAAPPSKTGRCGSWESIAGGACWRCAAGSPR
jgi:hypothetical protein